MKGVFPQDQFLDKFKEMNVDDYPDGDQFYQKRNLWTKMCELGI